MQVERIGLAHALAGEVDDEAVAPLAVITHLHRLATQVDRAFVALRIDREDIGLADLAFLFDIKHLGRKGVVGQEGDAVAVQVETVDGRHLDAAVELRVVFLLHPLVSQAVKFFQRSEVGMQSQEAVAKTPEETFDLALGGAVADGRVRQVDVEPQAGLGDFAGAVVAAVIEVEALRLAALVQGRTEGLHHILRIVAVKELGVRNDARGVVEEGDQEGFFPLAVGLFDAGAVQRVGLPQLIGELHGEGEALLVHGWFIEQLVFAQHAVKGGGRQLRAREQVALQEHAV